MWMLRDHGQLSQLIVMLSLESWAELPEEVGNCFRRCEVDYKSEV
jgi:hypothetical protein